MWSLLTWLSTRVGKGIESHSEAAVHMGWVVPQLNVGPWVLNCRSTVTPYPVWFWYTRLKPFSEKFKYTLMDVGGYPLSCSWSPQRWLRKQHVCLASKSVYFMCLGGWGWFRKHLLSHKLICPIRSWCCVVLPNTPWLLPQNPCVSCYHMEEFPKIRKLMPEIVFWLLCAHVIRVAHGTQQACMQSSLTFEYLSHHSTKICMLIEKKLVSSLNGREVTAGALHWILLPVAWQPGASWNGTP